MADVHEVKMIEHSEEYASMSGEKEAVARCLRALADKLDEVENNPLWTTQGLEFTVNLEPELSVHGQVFFD